MSVRTVSRFAAAGLLAAAALAAGGCTFQRTVVNPYFRDLDPTWIVPGETTWEDILDRWGPPTPPTDQALTSALPTLRYFRYPVTASTQFAFMLPPSYLILPWVWRDEQRTRDLFIEFDEEGRAADVYVRTEDVIWRPFEGEAGRVKGTTTFLVDGGAR